MKKYIVFVLFIAMTGFSSRTQSSFDVGEFVKLRIHYGVLNAGYATLEVKDAVVNNKKVFHAVGKGYTTGMSRFFFKVDDTYESYFDKETGLPYQFVRKIDEGGYTKNMEGFFDQSADKVIVKDYKSGTNKSFNVSDKTQDVMSMFYYLRNHPNIDNLKVGEAVSVNMFFDEEVSQFKLKFVGRENVDTKYGRIPSMIFKPLVQSGRVFKEQESVTVWISADQNKIPVRIKADLAVGSLKADLDGLRGLKYPLGVIKK